MGRGKSPQSVLWTAFGRTRSSTCSKDDGVPRCGIPNASVKKMVIQQSALNYERTTYSSYQRISASSPTLSPLVDSGAEKIRSFALSAGSEIALSKSHPVSAHHKVANCKTRSLDIVGRFGKR